MAEPLPHPELEQLLPAAALETLEGDELVLITAHVQECGNCRRLLESYRDVVATVATGLPDRPLDRARSAELRARLLARARGKASPAAPAQRSPGVVDRWAGWALAAGLAGPGAPRHSPSCCVWMAGGRPSGLCGPRTRRLHPRSAGPPRSPADAIRRRAARQTRGAAGHY
jgi:hypothetical protein